MSGFQVLSTLKVQKSTLFDSKSGNRAPYVMVHHSTPGHVTRDQDVSVCFDRVAWWTKATELGVN